MPILILIVFMYPFGIANIQGMYIKAIILLALK